MSTICMPVRRKNCFLSALIIFLYSCENQQLDTAAIRDFRPDLQPHLTRIVATGVVMYDDSALKTMATDKELLQLSQSEHPILRASAFREILKRKSFNHFHILMNHLDDTAEVATDAGEFGIWNRRVSDDILLEACWRTAEERDKTIEKVLSKHNYLQSAFIILKRLDPQEKYYPYIRDMATRPRRLSIEGYELYFHEIEYALYGLAKFKKPDDIQIIKNRMLQYVWELSDLSFTLMEEFPDTAYLDVLEEYHRRQFYKFSGHRPHGFTGLNADRASPEDFIEALAAQKNDRSAKLLDTVLNTLPKRPCMPQNEYIIDRLILEIWNNPCPAYTTLRNKIKARAEEMLKGRIIIPRNPNDRPTDTIAKEIRWQD